jgi:hypothetical protein
LLDQFSNLVYSLTYDGGGTSSNPVPLAQIPLGETNSIGLSGVGSDYDAFAWGEGNFTIGGVNDGQTLVKPRSGTNAFAWHTPGQMVTPLDTPSVPPFWMFNPSGAGHFSAMDLYYGYTNAAYPYPSGILRHRLSGIAATWSLVAMNIREGSLDSNGHGYVFGRIPDHTYRRLQTMEYFIEVVPNTTGVDDIYLGSDADSHNLSTIYTNFAAAEAHPFTYPIPIADLIAITNFLIDETTVTLQTAGNDPIDPLTNFTVKCTTNLLVPTNEWIGTNFIPAHNGFSNYSFQVQMDPSIWPNIFYRIDPRWP